MKLEICDLCRKKIAFYEKRRLPEAVAVLARAETVCRECRERSLKVDWQEVTRKAIREATDG